MRMINGTVTAHSRWFSPVWTFRRNGDLVATATRYRRTRRSTVAFSDGVEWDLVNDGWERVRAVERDTEVGMAERLSPAGRQWSLTCEANYLQLTAESMLGRVWTIGPPGAHLAEVHGDRFSYNTMSVVAGTHIPTASIMLAWHIVVRAWEAASNSMVDR